MLVLRNRSAFETKMFTKDPKTRTAYNGTPDAFEMYLGKNNLKITHDTNRWMMR